MKKLIFILIVGSLFMGCFTADQLSSKLIFTSQNLSISSKVKAGMTTDEVHDIMGEPVISELDRNVEQWHYCRTTHKDRFLSIFFVDNKVVAKKYYLGKEELGDCSLSIKTGDYKVPPEVQAILEKNTPDPPK